MIIKEGSYVLLYHSPQKTWLIEVSTGKKFHTHIGVLDIGEAVGSRYGSCLMSSKGKMVVLLEPLVYDFVMKSERLTQIVYPKDLAYIGIRSGLISGSRVLEIGTGSGGLTTYLASVVKPSGHVYTFDVNTKFSAIARKNIEKANLSSFVTFHDHTDFREVGEVDIVVVDIGDPWTMIERTYESLRPSGTLVAICPTMNQLEKMSSVLSEFGFVFIDSTELILRSIEARTGKTRPAMRMIGHTTYLIFGRKTLKDTL
ncbi:MAG TPA: tRNA (adenine-N1)-methyltransferase [Nitrososphaeraceae archaeon]|nr:tRNA (adenine-N1)-methyltransferase [Nitrososphaeraceae archaeon]